MPRIDPLHVPAECRKDDMDYQWFGLLNGRNPEATGWEAVPREAMSGLRSDRALTIDRNEMRLYQRPMALTERVRKQETAVAMQQFAQAVARSQMDGLRRIGALPLSSPLGAHPGRRTLRGLAIYVLMDLRRGWGAPDSTRLVGWFARTNEVGLGRWAEENRVTVDRYVALHTEAILEGKGRWPGQIVRGVSR